MANTSRIGFVVSGLALVLSQAVGCGSTNRDYSEPPATLNLPQPVIPAPPLTEPEPEPPAASELALEGEGYLIDAMVGQVNGRPIYASSILDDLDASLQQIAVSFNGRAFQDRAEPLINDRLATLVYDELIYDESLRNLDSRQLMFVQDVLLPGYREELVRLYGRGSVSVAEATLQRDRGVTLSEAVDQYQREWIIRRYLETQFRPLINVRRRDIERFYRDHPERYQSQATWRLRFIFVQSRELADTLAARLEAGEPFAEVASDPTNRYRAAQGGLWPDPVGADAMFGAVAEAYTAMEAGEWAGPIEDDSSFVKLVYVESFDPGESTSLVDAQTEIRQLLEQQQEAELSRRYRERLFEEGNYSPLRDMANSVLRVAVARYEAGESS